MKYTTCRDIICFGDPGSDSIIAETLTQTKEAALYFDRVWPLMPVHTWYDKKSGVTNLRNIIPDNVANSLLPDVGFKCFAASYQIGDVVSKIEKRKYSGKLTKADFHSADIDVLKHYFAETFVPEQKCRFGCCTISKGESIRQIIQRYALELGLHYPALFLPSEWAFQKERYKGNDISLSLLNVEAIDVSSASWDQIIELRKDEEAQRRVKNLRLFLEQQYEGKNSEYIRDDIERRLDDYEKARKKHGFDTCVSIISMVTSSKNLLTLGSASLIAALVGEPIAATLTAGTGVLIELSKLSLELAKRKYDQNEIERSHALSYIIYARKKLDK